MNKFKAWIQKRAPIIQEVIKIVLVSLVMIVGTSILRPDIFWLNLIGFYILTVPIYGWFDLILKS